MSVGITGHYYNTMRGYRALGGTISVRRALRGQHYCVGLLLSEALYVCQFFGGITTVKRAPGTATGTVLAEAEGWYS